MAVESYPYDDQDTTEAQYGTLMGALHDPGVVGAGDGLLVEPGSGGVTVRPGVLIARGFVLEVTGIESVSASSGDTIVARIDMAHNTGELAAIQGAPADTADVHEVPLGVASGPSVTDVRPWAGTQVGRWGTSGRPAGTPERVGWNVDLQRWESITPAGAAPLTLTVKVFDHAPSSSELADGELGVQV